MRRLTLGSKATDGIDHIEDLLELTLYHADLIEALGLDDPARRGTLFRRLWWRLKWPQICSCNIGKIVLAAPAGLWQDDNPGLDYNTTPITELRQALFADPDSDAALRMYPRS